MPIPHPFNEAPVIGTLSPDEAAAKLREMGDAETADALAQQQGEGAPPVFRTFGPIDRLFQPKAWQHTAHAIGFLPASSPGPERRDIVHAGNIAADPTLKNGRIRVTLNRLRVADYPGSGMHRVLFDFYAQNQVPGTTEELHFQSTVRAYEGEHAAVVGYPIFIGLNVGTAGVSFRCYTVNVKNDADEAFLEFLESGVAKAGLKLATVAQPSLAPFVQVAKGLTTTIAKRNRNVPVQDFYLGLDFAGTTMGARLAEGDYIAVQIPATLEAVWSWQDWVYNPDSGHIVHRDDPAQLIPYNYLVFGVNRYEEANE